MNPLHKISQQKTLIKIREKANNTSFGQKGYLTIKEEIKKQREKNNSRFGRSQWADKIRENGNLRKMLHVNSFQSKLERRGSQSVAHKKIGETLGSLKKVTMASLKYPSSVTPSKRV
ncbi:unnamed protein product [Moneuplotes crassus]|uniref:Uncharacterized protein n=1 Tax=Euplotes crassus TaxID=5936 RepID=A0AAD1UIR2_EUPCR|nr:unnamed protein product [Moneuplotes crassus]